MIKRFLDWFEKAPSFLTIPLIPLVLVLYVIAIPINYLKESSMFNTFVSRIRTAIAKRQARSKRLWARVEEPDQIIRPFWFGLFTLVFTALASMMIYNLFTVDGGPVTWIASLLATTANGSQYSQVYAAFGIALISLINLTIYSVYAFFAHADEDDVIEMISDLDANIQERLTEIENGITTRLDKIDSNT